MARKGSARRRGGKPRPSSARKSKRYEPRYIVSPSVDPRNLTDRSFEARNRALHISARMRREKVSFSTALREEGISASTVFKYVPRTVFKNKEGRWVAAKEDPYVRYLTLPGPHGPVTVRARGSKEARLASAYLAALKRWARTERAYELAVFHGKKIGDFKLITATSALRPLRDAGLLQLDQLYAALKEVA